MPMPRFPRRPGFLPFSDTRRSPVVSNPYPAITAIWPRSARSNQATTQVIILGTNFFNTGGGALTVWFGGVQATGVSVNNEATRITCTAPSHVAGAIDVEVRHSYNQSAWSYSGFTFYDLQTNVTKLMASIGGIEYAVRRNSCSVNEQPGNSLANFTTNLKPDELSQVRIGIGSLADSDLIFRGEVQDCGSTYLPGSDQIPECKVSCAGSVFKFKRVQVWETYTNMAADLVAQDLRIKYAPDFTGVNIQSGMPSITIGFDGSDLDAAFTQIKTQLATFSATAGYYLDKSEDIHLFLTETGVPAPDAIDVANTTMQKDPPFNYRTSVQQIRNRIYVRGAGIQVSTDIDPGETILPLDAVTIYSTTGGKVRVGTQVLLYSGVFVGGTGTLVGPGVTPSNAPAPAAAAASGIDAGVHQYAFTWKTAAGETLPSPIGTITTGPAAAPSFGPVITLQDGSGVTLGFHDYSVTFVINGETLPTVGGSTTTYVVAAPSGAPAVSITSGSGALVNGSTYDWVVTFMNRFPSNYNSYSVPETTASPVTTVVISDPAALAHVTIPMPDNYLITPYIGLYRQVNGGGYHLSQVFNYFSGGTSQVDGFFADFTIAGHQGTPGANTAFAQQVYVQGIPTGPSGTTARKIYRSPAGGGTRKLLTTINDNVTTQYIDVTPDGSLGANAPTTNTSNFGQVNLSSVTVGPATVTSRLIYRTVAGGSQLKLVATIADNTTTTYADAIADGSLGANAPSSDTSGLTQPAGIIAAGSTNVITAGSAPWRATGGWASVNGQYLRYTGLSGNSLTGIPASGNGSIKAPIAYNSSIIAAPSLIGIPAAGTAGAITLSIFKGVGAFFTNVAYLWEQVDDWNSQLLVAAREGNNGIHSFTIKDDTLTSADACYTRGQAELVVVPRIVAQASYDTIDSKSQVGRFTGINIRIGCCDPSCCDPTCCDIDRSIVDTILIQAISIGRIDESDGRPPVYSVQATDAMFTWSSTARRVVLGR